MSDAAYYARFKSAHGRRPRHAKATRWMRTVARVEAVKMWLEIALAPVVVLA